MGQSGWDIQDHYGLDSTLVLEPDFRSRFGRVTACFGGGNLGFPNLARVSVNGYPLDVPPEPEFSDFSAWDQDRSRSWELRVALHPALLQTGENQVRLEARMLPGLARVMGLNDAHALHNMSAAEVAVEPSPR